MWLFILILSGWQQLTYMTDTMQTQNVVQPWLYAAHCILICERLNFSRIPLSYSIIMLYHYYHYHYTTFNLLTCGMFQTSVFEAFHSFSSILLVPASNSEKQIFTKIYDVDEVRYNLFTSIVFVLFLIEYVLKRISEIS